jgi:hypothetical protein
MEALPAPLLSKLAISLYAIEIAPTTVSLQS